MNLFMGGVVALIVGTLFISIGKGILSFPRWKFVGEVFICTGILLFLFVVVTPYLELFIWMRE